MLQHTAMTIVAESINGVCLDLGGEGKTYWPRSSAIVCVDHHVGVVGPIFVLTRL